MKVNKNIWVGKSKPYNRNSLHFPDGINSGSDGDAPSGGESGDWEYYDCSNSTEMAQYATYFSGIVKKAEVRDDVMSNIKIGCYLFAYCSSDYDKHIALAIDYSQSCVDANGERTLREQIALYPKSELAQMAGMFQSLPRLTKEQFYSLD